jgi:protein-tyrosine phosphatase
LTTPTDGRGIRGHPAAGAEGRDAFRILHVCTGNVCRSPMAERLTRHELRRRLGDGAAGMLVESAGTWGHEGAPMEAHAAAVLAEYGADPSGFTGRELLDDHVIDADLVLTATLDHRSHVISMGHAAGLRTFTLKEFTRLVRAIDTTTLPEGSVTERARALVRAAAALRGWLLAPSPDADDVGDPYGAPLPYFRRVGAEISAALDPMLTALTGVGAPAPQPARVPVSLNRCSPSRPGHH